MLSLTPLIDDLISQPLRAEHGLAIWARLTRPDGSEARVLLDTGQHAPVLLANAQAAGADIASATSVVVSHGHYDHSGGLSALADMGVRCPVFVGVDAERRRFSTQLGQGEGGRKMLKPIGMPSPEVLTRLDVRRVTSVTQAEPGLTLFSLPQDAPVNRRLLAADGVSPDGFSDEVFALLSDGSHTILFGGCTHHGLPQLLDHVFGALAASLGLQKVDLFVGGLHLQGQPEKEVLRVADVAARYPVGAWIPLHCTGPVAQEVWSERFKVVDFNSLNF